MPVFAIALCHQPTDRHSEMGEREKEREARLCPSGLVSVCIWLAIAPDSSTQTDRQRGREREARLCPSGLVSVCLWLAIAP